MSSQWDTLHMFIVRGIGCEVTQSHLKYWKFFSCRSQVTVGHPPTHLVLEVMRSHQVAFEEPERSWGHTRSPIHIFIVPEVMESHQVTPPTVEWGDGQPEWVAGHHADGARGEASQRQAQASAEGTGARQAQLPHQPVVYHEELHRQGAVQDTHACECLPACVHPGVVRQLHVWARPHICNCLVFS